jgi:hypothetical protein
MASSLGLMSLWDSYDADEPTINNDPAMPHIAMTAIRRHLRVP